MRLLVPRRRRGRGLGGLAALAVLAAVAGVLLGRGETGREPPPAPTPAPPALDAPTAGPSLAVGITEFNPALVAAPETRGAPPPFERWRDALARIRPAVYRLPIVWSELQPRPDAPPDLQKPETGCVRGRPPCTPYYGVRDQLRALASRQREGGWDGMLVFTGTPEWAQAHERGCRLRAGFGPPSREALPAYRRLVVAVLALAAEAGARIRYVSPWNEPNHPYFSAPQRAGCTPSAPSRAVAPYARLVRALGAEIGPGTELVLGETAGYVEPTARATTVQEMIQGLPRRMVCSARVWSTHAYIGGADPVPAVEAALRARGCARPHAVWITETGVGPAPGGLSLARGITSERQGCRLLHRQLARWYTDPQVTLAIQYTFREDETFPTGLVTRDLTRARPALREWQAWGARDRPGDRPPAATCRPG